MNTYSWSGAPAAPGTKNVTATNNAALASANAPFTLTADDTAPAAGTVTYTAGDTSSTSVSVDFTTGTDAGSGVGTRLLQRASATLTGTTCGSFGTFATVSGGTNPTSPFTDTATRGNCYQYQYVVADNLGNQHTATSANVVKVLPTYPNLVNGTSGLVNYYRLGEPTTSADSMAGTAGATLQSRNGETDAAWTKHTTSTGDGVLTNQGRVRKNGATLGALYYTSAVPTSADYTVEADLRLAGTEVTNDIAGVVGRVNTGAATFYYARYEQANHSWNLHRVVNNTWTFLGSAPQTITSGTTYRLALDMTGTTIRVLVDGTQVISATDAGIAPAGRGGLALGFHASATPTVTDTNGMHLDNFRISPPMADAKGTNHGDYLGGVATGQTGAIAGDANTAASFDGTNDFGSVSRQIQDDFSIEFWFRSSQVAGTNCNQWWEGMRLVDAEVGGPNSDFGVSLCQGKIIAGIGNTSDVSIVTPGTYNNNAWHHVVFTRTKTAAAMQLYVDGALVISGTPNNTGSLTASSTITFGRAAGGGYFYSGSLDEVALYSTVLSPATISAHYAAAS